MTEPTQQKIITHLDTHTVRDLLVMGVPDQWCTLDNDDHIRARCEQEVTILLLTGPQVMREMSGKVKVRPRIIGNVRDYDVRLVRKPEDLDGLVVEHDDCDECIDTIETMRKGLPLPVMAVVQFTYDEIVDVR